MEDGKVHQRVGGHEKVGQEAGDGIELANDHADETDEKDQDVALDGVVVLAIAVGKDCDSREKFVFCNGLEDPWSSNLSNSHSSQNSPLTKCSYQRSDC